MKNLFALLYSIKPVFVISQSFDLQLIPVLLSNLVYSIESQAERGNKLTLNCNIEG